MQILMERFWEIFTDCLMYSMVLSQAQKIQLKSSIYILLSRNYNFKMQVYPSILPPSLPFSVIYQTFIEPDIGWTEQKVYKG